MNRHLIAASFFIAMPASAADLPKAVSVHDGDTFRASFRLENVDTAEIDGKCAYERDMAQRAKRFASEWIGRNAGRLTIVTSKVDRYGRPVALVSAGGEDLGEALISAGLARRWTGRREPWC